MKNVGIFYGSTTGHTQEAAEMIAGKMGIDSANVIDVSGASADQLGGYDLLILGSSTWGIGDLQDDWEAFIGDLEGANLSGKSVAVFGTGDSYSYPDSFCDAMAALAEAAQKAGAALIGKGVSKDGYEFDDSKALSGDTFIGLPLDADNQEDQSEARIDKWVDQLKKEAGL